MRRLVTEHAVAHVVTRGDDGTRHSSPHASLMPWDGDRLAFVEIQRGRTLANLERSQAIDVEVVDPLRGKGYRFTGEARVLTDGLLYDIVCAHQVEPELRTFVEAVVIVDVRSVAPLISPIGRLAEETILHRAQEAWTLDSAG